MTSYQLPSWLKYHLQLLHLVWFYRSRYQQYLLLSLKVRGDAINVHVLSNLIEDWNYIRARAKAAWQSDITLRYAQNLNQRLRMITLFRDLTRSLTSKRSLMLHTKKRYIGEEDFLLPTEAAGQSFIRETARLLTFWLKETWLGRLSFKALIIMPPLLL